VKIKGGKVPKTQVESLTDEILKATQVTPVMIPGLRSQLEHMVSKLLDAGFTILPPGADLIWAARHGAQITEKVQGTSVRCPGCGGIDPDLGFKSEVREIPQGEGMKPVRVGIAYIFCANETCHTILNIAGLPVQNSEGMIQ
jgi:hypothetical protein